MAVKRMINLTGLSGKIAQTQPAAPPPTTPQRTLISMKGVTTTGGTAQSSDPCDIYKRLLALGHPAEAESWLQLCNKNISGTTSGVSIPQQAHLAQLMQDYNLAATSRPLAIQITTLQALIDFLQQLYAGNPNIKNIQQQIAAFQGKMAQLQSQAPTDTSGTTAAADGTAATATPQDTTTATTSGGYVDSTSGASIQDPNAVASSAYADAISQGASPEDAQSYASQMADATVSANTGAATQATTTKQKAFFAGLGGLAGFALMNSNPVGAVIGAALGFFAPDILKKL